MAIATVRLVLLALFCGVAPVVSIPAPQRHDTSRNPGSYRLLKRQSNSDIQDFSWIKNYAAIGDSYAAGIGAGNRLSGKGDYLCSRTDQSYPAILNSDERMGASDGRQFSFLACSGELMSGVVDQISAMPSSQDLVTISAGGNDMGLVDILNHCIFQWWPSTIPSCDSYLDKASTTVNSADFSSSLDQILNAAKAKLSSNGRIYWTGYAQFFGTEDTQCDSQSWSFWFSYPLRQEYLTLARRQKMNALVDAVNGKISDAVGRAGGQAAFVDYGQYYDSTLGRFCEYSFPEPDPNRAGLLFYQWSTDDNAAPDNPSPRDTSAQQPTTLMKGTFEAQVNDLIAGYLKNNSLAHTKQTNLLALPQKRDLPGASMLVHRQQDSFKATPAQLKAGTQLSIIPDSYGRIFHPRPGGNALIANLVLYKMTANQASQQQQPVPEEAYESDVCPLHPHPPPAQPKPTCSGNSAAQALGTFTLTTGTSTPNSLLYTFREVLCNNKCERPAGLPDSVAFSATSKTAGECEISVPIQGGIEAWMYRGTPSTDDEWQDCWDSTQLIIEQCVAEGPNKGWVNGPNAYQFYEGGFRPLNDGASKHDPFQAFDTPLRSSLAIGAVSPDNLNSVTCSHGTGSDVRLSDCFQLLSTPTPGGFPLQDPQHPAGYNSTEGICTDSNFCVERAGTFKADGKEQMSHYCEIVAANGCAVVLSTKESTYGGVPGRSCVSPDQVSLFIRTAVNQCAGSSPGGYGWAAMYKGGENPPYSVLGLVTANNPGAVFSP